MEELYFLTAALTVECVDHRDLGTTFIRHAGRFTNVREKSYVDNAGTSDDYQRVAKSPKSD